MTTNTLPRVLMSGIDTLHVFTRSPLSLRAFDQLEALKESARGTRPEDRPGVEIAGHQFTVHPSGARTASYLLDSEHMALKAASANVPRNFPTASIELRSLFLWQRGAMAAADAAANVLAKLTTATGQDVLGTALHVSRIDLTVDFQGWTPVPTDLGRFVTRADSDTSHRQRRAFTGFMFGRGDTAARLYDKTTEIAKSGKAWFREIWAASGAYDSSEPVWRLEFQLRRPALRSFARSLGGAPLDTWKDVAPAIASLWRDLSTRWLSLRAPRTGRTRQRVLPEWQALVDGGFRDGLWAGSTTELYRVAREERARLTGAQLAAYLARGVAENRFLTGDEGALDATIGRVVAAARERLSRSGETLDERVQAYVETWRGNQQASTGGRSATVRNGTAEATA